MVNLAVEVAKMLDQVILSGVSLLTNVAGIAPISDKNIVELRSTHVC